MAETDDPFEQTAASMARTMLLAGAIGSLVAFARGWNGFAFALGAAIAWLNFRWIKRFVAGLGPGGGSAGFLLFFAFRYLFLAGAAYVILKLSKFSLPAMLAGLFVALAAALIEVLIQYARRNLAR